MAAVAGEADLTKLRDALNQVPSQFAAYSPFFTEAFEMVYRAMEDRDEEAEGAGEGVGEGRMRRAGGKGAFADGVWHVAEAAGRAGRTNITPTDAKGAAKAFWDWVMDAKAVNESAHSINKPAFKRPRFSDLDSQQSRESVASGEGDLVLSLNKRRFFLQRTDVQSLPTMKELEAGRGAAQADLKRMRGVLTSEGGMQNLLESVMAPMLNPPAVVQQSKKMDLIRTMRAALDVEVKAQDDVVRVATCEVELAEGELKEVEDAIGLAKMVPFCEAIVSLSGSELARQVLAAGEPMET